MSRPNGFSFLAAVTAAATVVSTVAACGGGSAARLASAPPPASRPVSGGSVPGRAVPGTPPVHGKGGGTGQDGGDGEATVPAITTTGTAPPGGGPAMFPGHRIVALYGHPGAPGLGALGQQGLSASIARARRLAAWYRPLSRGLPVIPALEIIATVAEGSPGPDGNYSSETPVAQLAPWVRRATGDGLYVLLDLQPGRASLLDQAQRYRSLLRQPDVGLALDPEWKLQPGQVPLRQIGHVSMDEVNGVIGWLAGLTARDRLPQKVLVLHQFRRSMITGEGRLETGRRDLAIVLHMDGQGSPGDKRRTWNTVRRAAPRGVFFGWKNFFAKDDPMISPRATLEHDPAPVMISYQ